MPAVKVAARITLPTGGEVYDILMAKIEPELMASELQKLDAKFATDTPNEKKARMQRYAAAFKAYDRAFDEYIRNVDEKARSCAKFMRENAETRALEEEGETQTELLTAINSL